MSKDLIMQDFDSSSKRLERLAEKIKNLTIGLIEESGLPYHSISARVKNRSSLEKKIVKKEKYSYLHEITDVIGIRIISYFEDDTIKISTLIENEFSIDKKNSIDKITNLEPTQFGYRSIHYIASINQKRLALPEYNAYKNHKFEIQVRSILQHAWAEIEHDIGYKTDQEIPQHLKRKFSKIAGLLEIADQEFITIKNEILKYREKLPTLISQEIETVDINLESLKSYIESSSVVKEIDSFIANNFNASLSNDNYANLHLDRLRSLDITSISELNNALKTNKESIEKFSTKWIKNSKNSIPRGISLFYLAYIKLAQDGDKNKISKYLKHNNIGGSNQGDEPISKIANDIIKIYNQIKKQ
ncbi:GTP pyrophosphokinase [Pseudogulbenkiania ferrooxidans]|uniref:GTP pyrophosphokinase n=1 Tax=Pseudogulbenkiania ferrooxidans TaxID=549169 RepID=UPI001378F4EB|nr:hypothetical protein [Pseudogulbenkiania ferrooxidans]